MDKYFRSKSCEEQKDKMDKQAGCMIQEKLDSMIHGSVVVSQ